MIIYKLSEMSSDDRLKNIENKINFIITLLMVKQCCKTYLTDFNKVECNKCHMKSCAKCINICYRCSTYFCDDCPGDPTEFSGSSICGKCIEQSMKS